MTDFRRVGVVGAGTMGVGLAAHIATAGVPVTLLDVRVPAPPDPTLAALIETGTVDVNVDRLAACDLVIEAVVEDADVKRALFRRLAAILPAHTIVGTNTSGIPVRDLAVGLDEAFRARFLGVHFFNPVRVMRLVELVPTADTTAEVVQRVERFVSGPLGKGVVRAKDAPGFIANRLGVFVTVETLRLMTASGLAIEDVDALTGPLLGRPSSATFRTGDITGIDVTTSVARGLGAATGEDFAVPAWVERLVGEGRLGAKSGAGYYRKEGGEILALDPATMAYRPRRALRLPALDAALALPMPERLRAAAALPGTHGDFVRGLLAATCHYTLRTAPSLADDVLAVDHAMEWGRGWTLGPFRMMDALGHATVRELLRARGLDEPPLLGLAHGQFVRDAEGVRFDGSPATPRQRR